MILGFILLMSTCFLQITHAENSSDFDFSMIIENSELILKIGDSATSIVSINLTSNVSENVSIHGEWTGNQPQNISVNLSNQQGIPPFSSNITFTSSGSETGNFVYHIIAESNNVTHGSDIQINIIFNNILTVQTDNNNYTKGECIYISGNITNNTVFSNDVTITLKNGNWKRYFTTNIQNNSYDGYYNISYGDPEGIWNITSETKDEQGSTITGYKNINVSLPTDTVRYKVVWFSPPENVIYRRGATFNISVFVAEDETGVKSALTNCTMPSMDKINLTEIKQGHYSESYTLPWDSQIGIWVLSLESTKGTGGSLKAGGNNISIEIKPATLKLDLIEPSLDEYISGETIEIKVNLSYSDNSRVKNAVVTAGILNENLTLVELENGTYLANYKITSGNKGSFIIEISASDPFNNNASSTKVIQIIYEEQNTFPFITILGAIAAILTVIFVLYILRKHFYLLRSQDRQAEIEEIQHLQNEAAEKYYKKGSISRTTYDLLRKEHTERLSELKKENKDI